MLLQKIRDSRAAYMHAPEGCICTYMYVPCVHSLIGDDAIVGLQGLSATSKSPCDSSGGLEPSLTVKDACKEDACTYSIRASRLNVSRIMEVQASPGDLNTSS